ncbi:MAG TPA: NAD(P)H-dependent oxidoreductase subunit E [Thermoflexales bacterium]|jgi:NADH-quinone oxidoreductase subunit E|nr:NAD(P)H-dependent oxidoreductase subunit E [Anaerolineae bacterium]HQV26557.1 NAD(P)H-dependent oxidoreductase subunit E [Thermoflexales bacterium]HQX08846.1 NAD(P)H-dependent oxidoreductase subunit E [Thermoflexales bacterium]HQY24827.1 NAD(P)H-dependent oxidoreductase subunit E [Thermoflexales bacterium]HQZ51940.1 NAD(P)H-dependent oxidoreductase subunit E [Thermoflexales bacterium]
MLRTNRAADIEKVLAKYPTKRSAVMPLLNLAQEEYGYCSPEAIREVAAICDLDPTEVKSVVGFYTMYYEEKVGTTVIDVCDDLPCALRGADGFIAHCERKLGIKAGETTANGKITLHSVMCVAACNRAPVAQVNGAYRYDLTPETFDQMVDELQK